MAARSRIRSDIAVMARKDPGLSKASFAVLHAILFGFCRDEKLFCHVGNHRLADETACCLKTVQRALKALEQRGYICFLGGEGSARRKGISICDSILRTGPIEKPVKKSSLARQNVPDDRSNCPRQEVNLSRRIYIDNNQGSEQEYGSAQTADDFLSILPTDEPRYSISIEGVEFTLWAALIRECNLSPEILRSRAVNGKLCVIVPFPNKGNLELARSWIEIISNEYHMERENA